MKSVQPENSAVERVWSALKVTRNAARKVVGIGAALPFIIPEAALYAGENVAGGVAALFGKTGKQVSKIRVGVDAALSGDAAASGSEGDHSGK